ncbi:hypothetical protein ACP_2867 [Acidobacterium capsulatum ATCC 51196]|uniref:Uncharacterized protein n=1 Tax=Acidobacterium capsulatum (strain ATCC 51196 / DSM 11244 / BCRC 80197 / JCM 7670 / NBRC 15755 / NCIMB 13165 / 161) TaxID=240015 RepID=C1F3S8_ACIC5|nr:hypothetical protein ACP_2867 [Acidobacterium capsulatum ATCC 51196]
MAKSRNAPETGAFAFFHWISRLNGMLFIIAGRHQGRQLAGVASLMQHGIHVFQNLIHRHRVHLAAIVVAVLDDLLEIAAGSLRGQLIRNDVASTLLLLDPGEQRHGNPDRAAADVKADIDGVGMARGNGNNIRPPAAMEGLLSPAVCGLEVLVHGCYQPKCPPASQQEHAD